MNYTFAIIKLTRMSVESIYEACKCCPHKCGVDRGSGQLGVCKTNDQPLVANVFLHKGEEPIISGEKGICNVFFAHCNLQCIYCQNYQISQNIVIKEGWKKSVGEVVDEIIVILETGIKLLGFVSPSHQVKQMLDIIHELYQRGFKPVIVYNSNGFDSVETLKMLDGIIDVYLPDFKYFSNDLAYEYSGVNDYLEIATNALKEMYRQKGSLILLDDDGLIESGVIVRHLVLPGHYDDSIKVLEHIANEVSPFLHISLMSQYYPTPNVIGHKCLDKDIAVEEYNKVAFKLEIIGFKGWIQEKDSSKMYRPDFNRKKPFSE